MREIVWRVSDHLRQLRERRQLADTQALGRRGEDIAHRYLKQQGLAILARRYRLADGSAEIDIIARESSTLVFVEVKTRDTASHGAPERAIGGEKEKKIVKAARSYLLRSGADWSQARFDIVAVVATNPPTVSHYRDAFFPKRRI